MPPSASHNLTAQTAGDGSLGSAAAREDRAAAMVMMTAVNFILRDERGIYKTRFAGGGVCCEGLDRCW